jgi:hypothetical protein
MLRSAKRFWRWNGHEELEFRDVSEETHVVEGRRYDSSSWPLIQGTGDILSSNVSILRFHVLLTCAGLFKWVLHAWLHVLLLFSLEEIGVVTIQFRDVISFLFLVAQVGLLAGSTSFQPNMLSFTWVHLLRILGLTETHSFVWCSTFSVRRSNWFTWVSWWTFTVCSVKYRNIRLQHIDLSFYTTILMS